MNKQSTVEKNVSANVTVGAMDLLRNHFLSHNTTAKYACRVLHLDYKHYGLTARVIKHRVKRMWGGANVKGDPQNPQTHRQVWYLMGGVPVGPVLESFLAASKGACNRGNAWYCSSNRNGQLNYRSSFLAARLLPSTRYLEVLCRDPSLDGLAIREKFELILYSTLQGRLPVGYDAAHISKDLSSKLVPKARHRRFNFPTPTAFWQLRFYKDNLGLVVQRDLSEGATEIETIENNPVWIRNLMDAIKLIADGQREILQLLKGSNVNVNVLKRSLTNEET